MSETEPFDFAAYVEGWTKVLAEVGRAYVKSMQSLVEGLKPLTDLLREHPELLVREEGPEPASCHHLCFVAAGHECTGEAVTTIRYRSVGPDVPVCLPCFAVEKAHAENGVPQ